MNRCKHCERAMRPSRGRAADYPRLVARVSTTCCYDCNWRVKNGVPLPGNDYECRECHKMVDTSYGATGPRPSRGGCCRACNMPRPVDWSKRACVECGVPLVAKDATPGPGQSRHHGHGWCHHCYQQNWRRNHPPAPSAEAVAAAERYARERRARAERRARVERVKRVEETRRRALQQMTN